MTELLFVAEHEGNRYEIVRDSQVGYYMFRYEGSPMRCTYDDLQDELDIAKECAEEDFGVPQDGWRKARPGEVPAYEDSAR